MPHYYQEYQGDPPHGGYVTNLEVDPQDFCSRCSSVKPKAIGWLLDNDEEGFILALLDSSPRMQTCFCDPAAAKDALESVSGAARLKARKLGRLALAARTEHERVILAKEAVQFAVLHIILREDHGNH